MKQVAQSFHGDRPIEAPAEDRLGFGPAATHVAKAIHEMASPDGFVIGIEGEWGSGKSSFVNLVSDALSKLEDAPETVRFLPWLISSREGLLKELFLELTKAALRISAEDEHAGWRAKLLGHVWPRRYLAQALRKKKLKGLFTRFSSRLVQAGKLAEIFGGATGAGVTMEAVRRVAEEWLNSVPLEKEKAQIQEELRKLTRKIVIFIDDLDRLEPSEVAEVLRLVRAVVDFPNVVYVLCYSREIIAKNLSTALQIGKGEEFLEKIIQVSFSVPRPEAFDLRRMFRGELQLLYPDLLDVYRPQSRTLLDRLAHVIDTEGGRALLTPRHVVRAVNALRFHATPVLENIDIPDMVWLQLIRLQSEELYKWVEEYLIGFAAKHEGAKISDGGKEDLQRLYSILDGLPGIESNRDSRMTELTTLPGIDFDFDRKDHQQEAKMGLSLYGRADVSARIREKRLGSPQHFRYYFALTAPASAIHDRDYAAFMENAQNSPKAAVAQFAQLAASLTSQERSAAQALLDRLKGEGIKNVPVTAIPGVLESLAESMDEAALKTGRGDWGEYWIWRDADTVFQNAWAILKESLAESDRQKLLKNIFGQGRSIGWLTNIFRREVFAHGIYGGKPAPESDRIFSRKELDCAAHELLQRYYSLSVEEIPRLPRVAHVLYAWEQYSPESSEAIREKVRELSASDYGFLNLLQGMRGWQATNGVVSYPLNESSLSRFMDVEQTRSRLHSLSDAQDPSIASSAKELLAALRAGDDD